MHAPIAFWSFCMRSPSRSAMALKAALRSPPRPDGVPLGPCTRGWTWFGACSLHRYRSASSASFVPPSFCHCGPAAHPATSSARKVFLMPRKLGSPRRWRHWTMVLSLACGAALAQELEPRAYSNAPIGTSFAILGYTHLSGPVLPDPSVPITDLTARVDILTLGYARFLDAFGRTANFAIVLPYANADLRGEVGDTTHEAHRGGLGDLHLRGAINLFGHPALTPAQFLVRPDVLSGGASLSVVVPTGQYEGTRLVNVGTNRWASSPSSVSPIRWATGSPRRRRASGPSRKTTTSSAATAAASSRSRCISCTSATTFAAARGSRSTSAATSAGARRSTARRRTTSSTTRASASCSRCPSGAAGRPKRGIWKG